MWINQNGLVVQDTDQYIDASGTLYPCNFPKSEIAELSHVMVLETPSCGKYQRVIAKPIEQINGGYVQGWKVVDWSADEIAESKLAERQAMKVNLAQARIALRRKGLMQIVLDVISQMPSPQKEDAQDFLDYAPTVERMHPLVLTMQGALGMSDEQMDDLFIYAGSV